MDDLGAASDGSAAGKRPGWPVDPYRIRRALWNGKRWVIGAALFGVLFGLFWVKVVIGPSYESVVVLKHEEGLRLAGHEFSTGHALEPAAEALHRDSVLRRIRERADLDWNLLRLAGHIDYRFDHRGGDTLEISVYGDTPEWAAEFAQLVTEVFLNYHRERNARRIEQEITSVSDRINAAQREAEEARRMYNEFRERNGLQTSRLSNGAR